jgi:hypothetical protein
MIMISSFFSQEFGSEYLLEHGKLALMKALYSIK